MPYRRCIFKYASNMFLIKVNQVSSVRDFNRIRNHDFLLARSTIFRVLGPQDKSGRKMLMHKDKLIHYNCELIIVPKHK